MTRACLKELIEILKPSQITADMYVDPLLRSMERIRERVADRYRNDLTALYEDRSLTDARRDDGYRKARLRREAGLKKLVLLEERYEREVQIPHLKKLGVLRDAPARRTGRRVLNRA